MEEKSFTQEIEQEISKLNSLAAVSISKEEIRTSGFSGSELALTIVTFSFGAISSSIFSAIGKDIWTGIRGVCEKIFKNQKDGIHYEVNINYPIVIDGVEITFVCTLSEKDFQKNFKLFSDKVHEEVKTISGSKKKPRKQVRVITKKASID